MWRSNTIAYGNVFYFINCIQMSTLKYNTIIDLSEKNVIYILLYFYCVCVIKDEDLLKFVSIKSVGTAIFFNLNLSRSTSDTRYISFSKCTEHIYPMFKLNDFCYIT